MKNLSFIKAKKFVTYVKKEFSTDKNDKNTFKLYYKVRDIVITLEYLGELLIMFVI